MDRGAFVRPVPKPFKYHSAEETKKPGYLAKRMALYRAQIEEQKKKDEEITLEARTKVVARIK